MRLPASASAFVALGSVTARQGTSRDEAVRQLLTAHVQEQEARAPDERLTHISTVLRYPAPPRWRREPRIGRPLRLRLDPGLATRSQGEGPGHLKFFDQASLTVLEVFDSAIKIALRSARPVSRCADDHPGAPQQIRAPHSQSPFGAR